MSHLLDQYPGRQLAVVGAQATIAALTLGQVDTLLVSASSDAVHDEIDADVPVADGAGVPQSDGTPLSEQVVHFLYRRSGSTR